MGWWGKPKNCYTRYVSPRSRAYIDLLITSAVWGIAGPVIRYTVGYLPPAVFLTYRFAISAAVGLVLLSRDRLHLPKSLPDSLRIIVYCLLSSTVSLGLLFLGYQKTSALTASVIDAIFPIMVSTVGVAFLHEHVTRREKLGLTVALGGTLLVIVEPLLTKQSIPTSTLEGNLLILASLVVGVVLSLMAKLIFRNTSVSPSSVTHLSFIIGFLTMLPLTFLLYSPADLITSVSAAPAGAHLGVLYMALLSGTLAYTLWHRAQKTIEIGEVSIFTYTYPLFAAPLAILWLKEPVTPVFIISAAVITSGVLLAEVKKATFKRK